MPFENLGDKLQSAFKDLRGKGKLSESDIDGALREVRRALLEADVNFKVAKDFIAHVREKAMGEEVFGSLKPDQTVIKIVKDELTELLGWDTEQDLAVFLRHDDHHACRPAGRRQDNNGR